jgi:hypothetical protein
MAEVRGTVRQRFSGAPRTESRGRRPGRQQLLVGVAVAAGVLLAILAWGGYGLGWKWTGLSSSVTLWDWLEVIALPVAVGLTPLLLRHRQHLTGQHRAALTAALVTFGVLVLTGYTVPLAWTGFTGNTLWDWFELLLLPVVVGTASLWAGREDTRPVPADHPLASVVLVVGFALLVACGYLVPWNWTGFRGNTAWDWIHLLLLPVLVPTLLLPALTQRMMNRIAPVTDSRDATDRPVTPARRRAGLRGRPPARRH